MFMVKYKPQKAITVKPGDTVDIPKQTIYCDLCGKEIPKNERHGGKPKYCMACLEELKDIYPFKNYYERRSMNVRRLKKEWRNPDAGVDVPKEDEKGD